MFFDIESHFSFETTDLISYLVGSLSNVFVIGGIRFIVFLELESWYSDNAKRLSFLINFHFHTCGFPIPPTDFILQGRNQMFFISVGKLHYKILINVYAVVCWWTIKASKWILLKISCKKILAGLYIELKFLQLYLSHLSIKVWNDSFVLVDYNGVGFLLARSAESGICIETLNKLFCFFFLESW